MVDRNLDVKLALEEMRLNMQQSHDVADALDQKVNLVMVAAGIILTLASTLQISLSAKHSPVYWVILCIAGILYLLTAGIALWAASPQAYRRAIASEWVELDQHLIGKSERDAILTLLAGYVTQIQHNRGINGRKVGLLRVCLATLGAIVVLLVVLAVIQ